MYKFTEQFISNDKNAEFLKASMMGPNAMRISEEMASHLNINERMRVLDLGCGCGLSSLFLAKKYGATVVAADLWISPTENYERFKSLGIDDLVMPISVDATKGLPFAERYFDVLFSVDSYHYYGDTKEMLPSLIPLVKKGGYIAIAIPGIKYEFGEDIPEEMKPFWNEDVARSIHSIEWWMKIWEDTDGIEIIDVSEMACCDTSWDEWHTSTWPGIEEDIAMRKAENGQYYNLIQMIARVL